MQLVIYSRYLLMKFTTPHRVRQARGDQKRVQVCYVFSTKSLKGKEVAIIVEILSIANLTIAKP